MSGLNVVSATAVTSTSVQVVFSEPVLEISSTGLTDSLNISNYTISPSLIVTSVAVVDNETILLTTLAQHNVTYTLVVSNVRSLDTVDTVLPNSNQFQGIDDGKRSYKFYVSSSISPQVGSGRLTYGVFNWTDSNGNQHLVPKPSFDCDYCDASKVLAIITAGTISSDPPSAQILAFERVVNRLVEVTPAHVELVPQFRQTLEATWNRSGQFGITAAINGVLLGPWTAYYDVFPTDDQSLVDLTEYGTISLTTTAQARVAMTATLVGNRVASLASLSYA